MRPEIRFSFLLRHYWLVLLPVTVLAIRMLVNIISRDVRGAFRRIFSLPEDLMMITLTILFGTMAGAVPNLFAYFALKDEHPYVSLSILAIFTFLFSILIHLWSAHIVQPRFQESFIASSEINARYDDKKEANAPLPPGSDEYMLSHFGSYAMGTTCWLIELSCAVLWLYYTANPVIYQ